MKEFTLDILKKSHLFREKYKKKNNFFWSEAISGKPGSLSELHPTKAERNSLVVFGA